MIIFTGISNSECGLQNAEWEKLDSKIERERGERKKIGGSEEVSRRGRKDRKEGHGNAVILRNGRDYKSEMFA